VHVGCADPELDSSSGEVRVRRSPIGAYLVHLGNRADHDVRSDPQLALPPGRGGRPRARRARSAFDRRFPHERTTPEQIPRVCRP
jgi:hypothetical protein